MNYVPESRIREKTSYLYKIVLIGESGAGKTSLINRFHLNKFNSNIQSTNGVDYVYMERSINGKKIKLHVVDTCGQEKYFSVCNNQVRDVQGGFLVYDLEKFQHLSKIKDKWLPFLDDRAPENRILFLYGNKTDLVKEGADPEKQFKLMKDYVEKVKADYKGVIEGDYVGSCKDQDDPGINQMMDDFYNQLYQRIMRKESAEKKKRQIQEIQADLPKPPRTSSIEIEPHEYDPKRSAFKLSSSISEESPKKKSRKRDWC